MSDTAECRGCGRTLDGPPYWQGGRCIIPGTHDLAKVNKYGGYVCSERCDIRACIELEQSMPGHRYDDESLSYEALASIKKNWGTI